MDKTHTFAWIFISSLLTFTSFETTDEITESPHPGVWQLDPEFDSKNRSKITLVIGMTPERVQDLLGRPRSRRTSKNPDEGIETWTYERIVKGPPVSSSINSQLGIVTVTEFLRFVDTIAVNFEENHLKTLSVKRRDDRSIPGRLPK